MKARDILSALLLLLVCAGTCAVSSCSKDDIEENGPSGTDGKNDINSYIHVIVKDDGTTSNGSIFSAIDDKNFYIDYIKYTVSEGHLVASGYDKVGFKGVAKIVSKVTYKGNTYEVLEIANSIFSRCKSLTSVIIGSGVKKLGNHAFYTCKNLTSVIIGNGIERIENETFDGCSSLTSITIGEGLLEIEGAFEGCKSLTSITLPSSLIWIRDGNFEGTPWYDNQPDGLIYIGKVAYKYKGTMPSGTSIIIKDGTETIGGNAFSRCSGLTSITFPNSVTYIDDQAFGGCTSLTSITIPEGVTSIGSSAFSGCSSLTTVKVKSISPPFIYTYPDSYLGDTGDTFPNRKNMILYVSNGCKAAYKAANGWKDFKEIIEIEMDE